MVGGRHTDGIVLGGRQGQVALAELGAVLGILLLQVLLDGGSHDVVLLLIDDAKLFLCEVE